jgi:ketosteroid isomerase-like protein
MVEQIENDQQLVKDLEYDFIASCLRADIERLDKILADRFIFTDPNGVLLTKAEWLDEMKSGEFVFDSLTINDLAVQVFNNIASVKAELQVTATSKKAGYHGVYSALDIYEKIEGKWQIILSTANQLIAHS